MIHIFPYIKGAGVTTALYSLGLEAQAVESPVDLGKLSFNAALVIVVILLWKKLGVSEKKLVECIEDRVEIWKTFANMAHQNGLRLPDKAEEKLQTIRSAEEKK